MSIAMERHASRLASAADESTTHKSPPQYHDQPTTLAAPQISTHSALPLRSLPDPVSRPFPAVPSTELPPIQPQHERSASASSQTLPSLSSVTGGLQATPEPKAVSHWPSLNPFTTYYTPSYAQSTEMPASPERSHDRRSTSVSLDDPDVRMAAEALGDLRADFVSSPPNRSTPLPTTPRDYRMAAASPRDGSVDQQMREPLLSLVTASYPLLATTIEGATSAYNYGKNLSPHLKTGAEYIEDYLTPVAKAVGTVGRRTGVEGGVKWLLKKQGRKHQSAADFEGGDRGSHKRRRAKLSSSVKESLDQAYPEPGNKERRESVSTIDTLPPYDDHRSPAYTEASFEANRQTQDTSRPGSRGREWGTQIVVTTSSLGLAVRDESLLKLKFLLERLRLANSSVHDLLMRLRMMVHEYNTAKNRQGGDDQPMAGTSDDCTELISRMDNIKNEIVTMVTRTLQMISEYPRNILPDNTIKFIASQVVSLPWRLKTRGTTTQPQASEDQDEAMGTAHRVVVIAEEGLKIVGEVSCVLDKTIQSAEEWCQMMGKRKREGADAPMTESQKVPPPAQWATPPATVSKGADATNDDIHMVE